MFEKEVEEFVDSKKSFWRQGRTCIDSVRQAYQKGAEFGYNKAKGELEEKYKETICNLEMNLNSVTERLEELNKANEWHYVKDGDLPNTETKNYTYIQRRKRNERQFTDYRVIM